MARMTEAERAKLRDLRKRFNDARRELRNTIAMRDPELDELVRLANLLDELVPIVDPVEAYRRSEREGMI